MLGLHPCASFEPCWCAGNLVKGGSLRNEGGKLSKESLTLGATTKNPCIPTGSGASSTLN